ncbi:sucrose-6-phosphate hydrolase [Streptococcus ovuberis]|uniref:Sucrose-6-phosphate hydrolase n=1 Tax=Streptococcus ovuberis TaxID=1936207 RepID=A0A7X6S084_9STRE|nr:sucrose-6-phosphate hydrolase [Streptococcus ovuberis]NKZ19953.1 sucrose-6-phosphate hydrolase [Streptococcus ovuberis]
MPFDSNLRYRPYEDWTAEEIQAIEANVAKSPWRSTLHIEPQRGLLNDPNGFSYFNGQFHLFYQWFPFGAAHGLKSWFHTVSDDLVHFQETGTVLLPDHPLDTHGMYSGSAMQMEDKLFIFYTGNCRDAEWVRHPYQNGALMTSYGDCVKFDKPLITQPKDTTDHFRDPQIFDYKGQYYAIIGGQDLEKKGMIKLYKAVNNDYKQWQEIGNLDFANDRTAYMMECPNLIFINDQPILLYCPQGLDKSVFGYDNIYPNLYKIGKAFDPEQAAILEPSELYNLDYGFECYATQAFNSPDGRALSVSWLGLPDVEYPTDHFDHQGVLSLVKELTLKEGKLYQYPVEALKNLRQEPVVLRDMSETDNVYELEITIPAESKSELVLLADQAGRGLRLEVDTQNGLLTLDRSQAGEQYALEFGQTRECPISKTETTLNIFIDKSIFEIFINKGEKVLSGRVFPNADQSGIRLTAGPISGTYYALHHGR